MCFGTSMQAPSQLVLEQNDSSDRFDHVLIVTIPIIHCRSPSPAIFENPCSLPYPTLKAKEIANYQAQKLSTSKSAAQNTP